ncbi:ethyl tert-butyl ether degradation protein EthD [Rhodococcus opacus PD630]|uniref:EthD family reductase n=1 Tax=Rhodococcus TaxID=1827 RepID=UPI00029CB82E|nr:MULTISPECIES: EthD family reductase [Rhodococcus]KXF48313.1 ethyl tert-butyl ether degradation protein EthD [Rhodococcus sp. SC4]RZK81957.1 MAG: EthD family reductase [Rhodococcus sp. (in: high G+C Gram-positive bacteria)]AHK34212.1 putative 11.0 kDa protein in thcB-thcC intergenic region [Rhodococcus opacus PD630]EHI39873.1 ethyl tert-butyl ether degradation protein EthD [Rhodococcus opacus PD630]KXX60798.1 ethyl tert-butyl ether degradation protein EthD [Rhodococcus sp. LB1]
MSFKVAVCYGQPDDPEAFDAYYRDTHMPLARKVPGLTDFTWGKCSALDGGTPPYYAVASLVFPDAATMKSGLQSEEMKQAGKDVRNFATGGVTMYVQEEESVYNQ